jgi:pSer/pThr/pTyr-binding forkhead associated (FHA) protein
MESFTNTPHKTIHVVTIPSELARKKNKILVKVGRGTEVDVRITDISVSRFHSKIYFSKGEFYCQDNNSKFGTVALLRQPISLPQKGEHFFQIQVGKHLIELESESHIN